MLYGPLFSGIIKPSKPLYYAAEVDTQITNIALDPSSSKPSTSSTAIEPVIVKLTYEGQKIEEEEDDDDERDDDEESEAAYEAKEVVICSLIPGQILQANVNIVLEQDEQYHFSITGGAYNVHLLGHYINQDADRTPYSSDSDDSDDEELDSDELGEYDEEDLATRKALGLTGGLLGEGSEEDSDEESDDEDEGRIQEIRDEAELLAEEEKIAAAAAKAKAKVASPAAAASKKRPAPADGEDDDASMADADASMASASATADGQKLSKSQKKKLAKKMKKADGTPADAPVSAPAPANGADEKAKAKAKEPEKKEKKAEKTAEAASSKAQPVTMPSGLKYLDTKPGSGASAKPGQKVSMRYIGKLASNGKVFDQNTKGAPFKFQLGKGEVIKGWDEGIKGMKVGGERKLTIPANLAYGKRGAPPDIPSNATLTFEVKMLAIN